MPTASVLACAPLTVQSFIHWRHSNENVNFGLRWETFFLLQEEAQKTVKLFALIRLRLGWAAQLLGILFTQLTIWCTIKAETYNYSSSKPKLIKHSQSFLIAQPYCFLSNSTHMWLYYELNTSTKHAGNFILPASLSEASRRSSFTDT